jgi:hypothetical protein
VTSGLWLRQGYGRTDRPVKTSGRSDGGLLTWRAQNFEEERTSRLGGSLIFAA